MFCHWCESIIKGIHIHADRNRLFDRKDPLKAKYGLQIGNAVERYAIQIHILGVSGLPFNFYPMRMAFSLEQILCQGVCIRIPIVNQTDTIQTIVRVIVNTLRFKGLDFCNRRNQFGKILCVLQRVLDMQDELVCGHYG